MEGVGFDAGAATGGGVIHSFGNAFRLADD